MNSIKITIAVLFFTNVVFAQTIDDFNKSCYKNIESQEYEKVQVDCKKALALDSNNSRIVNLKVMYGRIADIPASESVECKILTLKDNSLFIDPKTEYCVKEIRTLIHKTYWISNRLG